MHEHDDPTLAFNYYRQRHDDVSQAGSEDALVWGTAPIQHPTVGRSMPLDRVMRRCYQFLLLSFMGGTAMKRR